MNSLDPAMTTNGVGVAPDPPYDYAPYRSTHLRAPKMPLQRLPAGAADRYGPVFGPFPIGPTDNDLTAGQPGAPLGERIIVAGRLLDQAGKPVRQQLVEIWQANAAGRYWHQMDRHPAPLDPNFTGAGRCLTDDDGRYRFVTVKPGAYPWQNHAKAFRPAHIHFSVFGTSFVERLVTQMYFPGDPLLEIDPIFQSVRDRAAAERLVSKLDLSTTMDNWALGYTFDIIVGGRAATPPDP